MSSRMELLNRVGLQQRTFPDDVPIEIKNLRILLKSELLRCIETYENEKKQQEEKKQENGFNEITIDKIIEYVRSALYLLTEDGFTEENLMLVVFLIQNLDYAEGLNLKIYRFKLNLLNFCDRLLKQYKVN